MKNLIASAVFGAFLVFMSSCSNKESLQQYYVDSAEKEGFVNLDIPSSMLDISNVQLTENQKEAYNSIKKLNVLAFPVTAENKAVYEAEKTRVNSILSGSDFHELLRLSDKNKRAVLKYTGNEGAIDEVIFFGTDNDRGFALVRILGNDMNPEKMVEFIKIIEKGDIDDDRLGELKGLFGK
ncbi:DUF4252 domain-containing protein [Sinomicrobium weinanense]|uniref:DUF4252 domain-containing protein n=1 Tax=Sinomicrobium weinanense TaxID=2842200 RepID=A0A926JP53_9FLAO|nr:DUF4252 domain-containing protein [Sinomicrobium weinanense]MBC9794821.1 DUF4252 domain-containing protein [Sinomicrobium weinanense]MBU3125080.1 DUF4252 domain-containing protein [Sinomicrobium weinanense]